MNGNVQLKPTSPYPEIRKIWLKFPALQLRPVYSNAHYSRLCLFKALHLLQPTPASPCLKDKGAASQMPSKHWSLKPGWAHKSRERVVEQLTKCCFQNCMTKVSEQKPSPHTKSHPIQHKQPANAYSDLKGPPFLGWLQRTEIKPKDWAGQLLPETRLSQRRPGQRKKFISKTDALTATRNWQQHSKVLWYINKLPEMKQCNCYWNVSDTQ